MRFGNINELNMNEKIKRIALEEKSLRNEQVNVYSIVKEKRTEFVLEPYFDEDDNIIKLKDIYVKHSTVIRPHFALTGYFDNFVEDSIVIFGRTEIEYLSGLEPHIRKERLRKLAGFRIPCVFINILSENEITREIIEVFNEKKIPIYGFKEKTPIFVFRLTDILDDVFAPKAPFHGNLVEVFSVGILIIGDSGIGKSELTLELVAKGHLFVADDIVFVIRKFGHKLLGYGNQSVKKWIEIRGAGIFDITHLFGVNRFKTITEVENVIFLYSHKNLEEKVTSFTKKYLLSKLGSELSPYKTEQEILNLSVSKLFEEYTNIPDEELFDIEFKIYKRILKYSVESRLSFGTFPATILGVPVEVNPIDVYRVRDVSVIVEAIASRQNSMKHSIDDYSGKLSVKTSSENYLFPPNYYKYD